MKKALFILILFFVSVVASAQRYYSRYYYPSHRITSYSTRYYPYSYSGNIPSPFAKESRGEPGLRWSWPVNVALSGGEAFVNGEDPEYAGGHLNKNFFVFGGKICGILFGFGDGFDFTNESILGYTKKLESIYTRLGLELGKFYYTTPRKKVHSFSIAPTYTYISYRLYDGSGNNIGWTDLDQQRRQEFYEDYPATLEGYLGGWGMTFNYNYEYFGIDLSISKRVVEVSLVIQLDLNPWIHTMMVRNR